MSAEHPRRGTPQGRNPSRHQTQSGRSDGSNRKRAGSNYFQLESDRKRIESGRANDARNSNLRQSMLTVMSGTSTPHGMFQKTGSGGGLQGDFDDEVSIDYCCDILFAKFGFQSGSVDNQREHLLLLLANMKARCADNTSGQHVTDLHRRLISNYIEWCRFLKIEPATFKGQPQENLKNPLHMEMLLLLLIWGESANIRLMPECLCYLYHQMLTMLNEDLFAHDKKPEGWFLTEVARPIIVECSNMKRKNSLGKPLEHVHIRNYDDINEYFWKKGCLNVPVTAIGKTLTETHGKTFYEHRSMFTLVLNYYRIFQFNLLFLMVLIILSFCVSVSPGGGETGFSQFGYLGQVVDPYTTEDLKLSVVSFFLVHAGLAAFKCLLEIAHGWHLLFSKEKSDTSSRSFSYGAALVFRLAWNGAFGAIFFLMIYYPLHDGSTFSLYSSAVMWCCIFFAPGLLVLLVQAFLPQAIGGTFLDHFVREGETCYVGRNMAPALRFQLIYIVYWLLIWIIKALVSYFILIRPLMLPSLAIYEMDLDYSTTLVSFHNIGFIIALWAPVVGIFNYDTQIYFTIFEAILGAIMGVVMKTGEITGIKEMAKAFRVAPQLFDRKIVTSLARSNDAAAEVAGRPSQQAAVFQSQMMLRFVVVWNEIVNSFREGDLVDDKEAAILQYDIQSTGEVFEPVFLSAGKLGEAMTSVIKLSKSGKGDSQLRVNLVENDCLSAVKSFFSACMYVLEALLGNDDAEVLEGFRIIEEIASHGEFMRTFNVSNITHLRSVALEFLEAVLDLPDPDTPSPNLPSTRVHTMGVVRNFVAKMENLLNCLQSFCQRPDLVAKFNNTKFTSSANGYVYATRGLVNLYNNDAAMGAATRAYLLMSLERSDAMPRCQEAKRRLGFFMKSLVMEIPQLRAVKEMRSFSVVTPFYSESVLFSLDELNNALVNHPIFSKVEENGKNITILKYLITIHPEEWENFLERIDVSSAEEALANYPQEIRLWASYRGQTLARTVQGMMLYEDAIKILHWLEIGSSPGKTAEQKQAQLEDMVRLKFSYICACQVYGKHRAEGKAQATDIDFLLHNYPNLRVAYVDTLPDEETGEDRFDTVLIKSENGEIVEVYRYELPGNPIIGEGKPENQNNAIPFTRGEFLQTIDMNQQHYFEECLKMPQLLHTASLHPSKKPVSIIGMREHIFTGNASSLSKFKSWQELVFVTLSQRVLANPLCVRMHYGHPDVFDKITALTRGGVSKASKGINLSEDVFAGFNSTLRGGVITHIEFMQCGKGRDVALSQISMFEGKLANGAGETSLAREAHRMGQFMDFFRLNSMYYSHTGFYFATWLTIVTTFIYMYSKLYMALSGVQADVIENMNSTTIINGNVEYGFDSRVYSDVQEVINTQFYIQAGIFLSMPLIAVYFTEMGLVRGMMRFIEMIVTLGWAFFVFQVGTTMHYFDSNLLHGNAKYQATGRGFKITRETFVLLYKAYQASHYRKAFELVGLCFIYLTYGNFNVCDRSSTTDGDTFASDYCDTAQGFGVQTFAIWFIACIWLLSPFMFNADGLDWEKTKMDVRSWCKWMFMEETDTDEDKTNEGGWIKFWKGEVEQLYGTKMIARVSVILRESRHFFVMWYVITLNWNTLTFLLTLAAAGASLFVFGMVHVIGKGLKSLRPIFRALIYLGVMIAILVVYFVGSIVVFDCSSSESLSLFFGFLAALYGINEMARVVSFTCFSVSNIFVFQQLAFFFDFGFGLCLLVPLLILSAIPFMNVIQTRMMYNEGFSKVMSASSQYAFSVSAFLGILGGVSCGWTFYMLTSLDSSPGFINYVEYYSLDISAGSGVTTYLVYFGGAAGSIVAGLLLYFVGRRLSIVFGGICSAVSLVVLSALPSFVSAGKGLLYPGIILMGVSIGVMLPSLCTYIYEISTHDMRGKALLLLGVGFNIGMIIAASYDEDSSLGWVWQIFICTILFALITPSINMFPESPQWTLESKGLEACEANLIILRRKQDVSEELRCMKEDHAGDKSPGGDFYKVAIVLCFTIISALNYGGLNLYMSDRYSADDDTSSQYMMVNSIAVELVGAILSFFFMDKLAHKVIIFGTFIPIALCVALFGANSAAGIWDDSAVYTKIIGLVLYFFLGLGTSSVLWATMVGLFTTRARGIAVPVLFALFYLIPCIPQLIRKDADSLTSIWLFVMAAICVISIVLLIGTGSKTNGMICTKSEMAVEKERIRRVRSSRRSARTPGSARSRNLSRSRAKSQSRSNYHLYESPAGSAPPPVQP